MRVAKAARKYLADENVEILISICPYCKVLNTNEHLALGPNAVRMCEHYRGIIGGCGGNAFNFDRDDDSINDMHLEDRKVYLKLFRSERS